MGTATTGKTEACMRPMESQWQQKNAAFLVEQKPETWEEKWEKEISQWGRRASSGVHETHEEFSCKFRQTLQEFAMLLTKKFHYEFPVEYFDDYQGNLNKEEFLGVEQPKEKARLWKTDSLFNLDFEEKRKKFSDEGSKEDGCKMGKDCSYEEYNSKKKCIHQGAKAAETKVLSDILEREVHVGHTLQEQEVWIGDKNYHVDGFHALDSADRGRDCLDNLTTNHTRDESWDEGRISAIDELGEPAHSLICHQYSPIGRKSARRDTRTPLEKKIVKDEYGVDGSKQETARKEALSAILFAQIPVEERQCQGNSWAAKKLEVPIVIGQGMIGDIFTIDVPPNGLEVQGFDREIRGQLVAERELRERFEEVNGFVEGNKIPTVALILNSVGKSRLLPTKLRDEPMTSYVLKVETNLNWVAIANPRDKKKNIRAKKKRPRRRKKEKRMNQMEKAGIG